MTTLIFDADDVLRPLPGELDSSINSRKLYKDVTSDHQPRGRPARVGWIWVASARPEGMGPEPTQFRRTMIAQLLRKLKFL